MNPITLSSATAELDMTENSVLRAMTSSRLVRLLTIVKLNERLC